MNKEDDDFYVSVYEIIIRAQSFLDNAFVFCFHPHVCVAVYGELLTYFGVLAGVITYYYIIIIILLLLYCLNAFYRNKFSFVFDQECKFFWLFNQVPSKIYSLFQIYAYPNLFNLYKCIPLYCIEAAVFTVVFLLSKNISKLLLQLHQTIDQRCINLASFDARIAVVIISNIIDTIIKYNSISRLPR